MSRSMSSGVSAGKPRMYPANVMTCWPARPATSCGTRDPVLLFLACSRLSGLMFSRPMNTRVQPARAAFSMKFGILWHCVSTWMRNLKASPSLLAHLDQAVEDRLPVPVAGEIVVGDEEAVDALGQVDAHHPLDVVGVAPARLAPLHVDDRAEAALERAAAPGVEARASRRSARTISSGRNGVTCCCRSGRSFM